MDYESMMMQVAPAVGGTAEVHETALVEENVRLGDGVKVGAGAIIRRGTVIGPRTEVRSGAVIGEAGIAVHLQLSGDVLSQPHLGLTVIGEDCQIGANAVVMRAMLDETRIGSGTIVGNLCNIGHGAAIAEKVWMSVGCLIGGHAVLDDGVTLGMGVQVRDNVTLGSGTQVGMGSVVLRSAPPASNLFGSPAKPIRGRLTAGPER
ncbi:DapH/DapD/GlmU-related protein [Methyloceanibacter sp. wino2]|uniref:DapH/DapD/GlmU-related protein n=1 Tax=Methyloceanibacter sp. wino2 TaxID=2170729 RepID=UPI00131EFCA4|nr:DapH/DapD/GlmU-related protein [Methyloceanibacter sp. wino2]